MIANRFDIKITESKVYQKLSHHEIYVAQLPGSIYPTATIRPGPVNARSFRQKPASFGILMLEKTSGKEFEVLSFRHAFENSFEANVYKC